MSEETLDRILNSMSQPRARTRGQYAKSGRPKLGSVEEIVRANPHDQRRPRKRKNNNRGKEQVGGVDAEDEGEES